MAPQATEPPAVGPCRQIQFPRDVHFTLPSGSLRLITQSSSRHAADDPVISLTRGAGHAVSA